MGVLGCVLCVVGSTVIVLHAPSEHSLSSVDEIWELAIQPGKPFKPESPHYYKLCVTSSLHLVSIILLLTRLLLA